MVHRGNGIFEHTKWKNLRVGDIIKVEKNEYFPADLVLLSSSYDEGICYVETTNLDGETNLKLKQALEVTSHLNQDSMVKKFRAVIRCEDPNANLYTFVGSLDLGGQQYSLSAQQLLLRESKLQNTDYIYGVCIFTGHDTKVIQNSVGPPSKRSKIERRTDKIVFLLFLLLIIMSIVGSSYFGAVTSGDLVYDDARMARWYLRPDYTAIYYDPRRAAFAGILHFFTAVMLYGNLIPISLYVSIEIVKVLQSVFINKDIHMYYEEGDKPAQARTSNLNEELGQVDTILSDKTGTLTCNSMEFVKCSIAGTKYGRVVTEVERAMARRKRLTIAEFKSEENFQERQPTTKGYNFVDERITDGKWVNEPRADIIQKFFQVLAICHTVMPERDETGSMLYEAEYPDELAFVVAARELGFEFYERTQSSISVREFDCSSGTKVERTYELLNIIEFSSSRKRMSVIVRNEEGKILLFCKGADSVMFERLACNGREFERQTREHVLEFAEAGLRTLILAYCEVNEDEYTEFDKALTEAKNSVSANREKLVEEVADSFERNLILLGATAVEDRLQNGVPECIDKLSQAGIKLWVLTGDKMETAINIGYACSLLREGMRQIVISSETNGEKALEKLSSNSGIHKALKASVMQQIREGKELLNLSSESSEALALIIDGKSLTYALEDDVKDMFLELSIGCASVICCRSSPKQKALDSAITDVSILQVARLVKTGTGATTLAIGDGANDVGMLQEADIGVGISGFEGMQAVMASDIAIAQFRFLERLLLVHGHWCYRRISSMICYFFYKNIVFSFTLFYYDAYASFSGGPAYNDWYIPLYNVCFTALPVIALGVLDQDVSAQLCLEFPLIYQEGVQNILFGWKRILCWTLNGILNATTIFYFCIFSLETQAFRGDGQVVGFEILGATLYTCVVCVVNAQMALAINYFTYIQHLLIWGSILYWYVFLLAFGALDPLISTTAYKVLTEACAPSGSFWLVTLLVSISSLLPYFIYAALWIEFFPLYHQRTELMKATGQLNDPEFCDLVRQRPLTTRTVGYTARFGGLLHRNSMAG
ncbi:hypothetical protein Cgig2_015487 [Carnegiea gigantea]|uniref:Phospholipid-transporting ATPase n=1 Tax=Carnegiea gigantea TaxID=171969 RepID=A0A9Q1KG00_9CARY|nr:hypothetical protein Cgig2_015487 [Carnegiea gigantea]